MDRMFYLEWGFLDGDSDHFERCQAGACRLDLETVYRACGRGSGSILFLRARIGGILA